MSTAEAGHPAWCPPALLRDRPGSPWSYCGLRHGEAAALKWEDVDLDGAALAVRRQRVQLGWEVIEEPPSPTPGSAPSRWMRAPGRRWLLSLCPAHRAAGVGGLGKVFTRENGEPLHPASITDRFHDLVATADLPPVRLHDLRHGAAPLVPRAARTDVVTRLYVRVRTPDRIWETAGRIVYRQDLEPRTR